LILLGTVGVKAVYTYDSSGRQVPAADKRGEALAKGKKKLSKKRPADFAFDCPGPPFIKGFTKEKEI
jgi:hypothetical protein